MTRIEILAPCGGFETLSAAVRSGADAVYLGAQSFSARAGAENFSEEELVQAVKYCHIRGVKVYLTLNTVLFDDELDDARKLIITAARADIDALLVQNMGVATLAREIAPELPLHASTQMSVHSPSGAKLLYEMGFKRVVLARELSRAEIKEIAEAVPIELEVFVHGALCMSVSGQCYFSAVLGQRSGNRGRCAQPCRLPFSVKSRNGYALSLKDMSAVRYLRDMESIGIASAKIEGRLKRPEYVAAAVKACVKSRDEGFVDEETERRLESVFSRTGFTDGYYTGRRGYDMFGYRRRDDVTSATSKLFSKIREGYKDELQRVRVEGKFTAFEGEKPTLTVTDGSHSVTVEDEQRAEQAVSRPLDYERVRSQITKTGGTPYSFASLETELGENVSLPVSALNRLRRNALDELSVMRERVNNYRINDIKTEKPTPHMSGSVSRRARFTSTRIGEGFKGFELCFVPFDSDPSEVKSLIDRGFNIGAEIPRALFSREKEIIDRLKVLRELGVEHALCNNLGAVYIASELGMKIHGGFGLNFTNTRDLIWAESYGFEDAELSFELDFERISALGGDLPRGTLSFGYLPLMLTRNCPNRSAANSCKGCPGNSKMTDRMGKSFKFYCDGCACEILNSVTLDVVERAETERSLDFAVFRYSVENYVENVENEALISAFRLKEKEKTNGLYLRGVF